MKGPVVVAGCAMAAGLLVLLIDLFLSVIHDDNEDYDELDMLPAMGRALERGPRPWQLPR